MATPRTESTRSRLTRVPVGKPLAPASRLVDRLLEDLQRLVVPDERTVHEEGRGRLHTQAPALLEHRLDRRAGLVGREASVERLHIESGEVRGDLARGVAQVVIAERSRAALTLKEDVVVVPEPVLRGGALGRFAARTESGPSTGK